MMGVSPAEAAKLSLWTYEALLWNWNERHKTDDDETEPVELPSAEFVEHRHLILAERGLGTMVH
jgi:hypothetical protein